MNVRPGMKADIAHLAVHPSVRVSHCDPIRTAATSERATGDRETKSTYARDRPKERMNERGNERKRTSQPASLPIADT